MFTALGGLAGLVLAGLPCHFVRQTSVISWQLSLQRSAHG
jgi:hypothetical protein